MSPKEVLEKIKEINGKVSELCDATWKIYSEMRAYEARYALLPASSILDKFNALDCEIKDWISEFEEKVKGE